jgi:hypothetical protein
MGGFLASIRCFHPFRPSWWSRQDPHPIHVSAAWQPIAESILPQSPFSTFPGPNSMNRVTPKDPEHSDTDDEQNGLCVKSREPWPGKSKGVFMPLIGSFQWSVRAFYSTSMIPDFL